LVCVAFLSACGSNPRDGAGNAEKLQQKEIYDCSDIGEEAALEEDLKRNHDDSSVRWSGSGAYPHLERVAKSIAVSNAGRRFTVKNCSMLSEQTVRVPFKFSLVDKNIHYIIETKISNNYISEICVTRNEYSLDYIIDDELEEYFQQAIRDYEESGSRVPFYPHRTEKCFKAGELR